MPHWYWWLMIGAARIGYAIGSSFNDGPYHPDSGGGGGW